MFIRDMRAARGDPRTRRRHRWGPAASRSPTRHGWLGGRVDVRRGPGLAWPGRVVRAGLGADCQNRVIKARGRWSS